MIKIDKVYTDTPLIDEIVRQCKEMIYNGIVLKDQAEAGEMRQYIQSSRLIDMLIL